ncbi:MAG: ECF transporter S component [Defluviitaleaceae bacterium]|nr:ECF transporter S component [Defluviitaleaceae bacterium]
MSTKQLTTLAMIAAVAYALMFFGRIPVISIPGLTLKYDPKDIVLVIGGFLFGPLPAFLTAAVVALIEMVTASETGPVGMIMNLLSSAVFVCTASAIYKIKKSIISACIGLAAACIATTTVMLLWNYLITPIYVNVPREVVAGMLIPYFLPFNMIKSGLNAGIAMLLYKPVSVTLRKMTVIEKDQTGGKTIFNIGGIIISVFVIVTCVLFILAYQGKI